MVSNNMTDGVGKRIVDALKQQGNVEINQTPADTEVYNQEYFDNSFNEEASETGFTDEQQSDYSPMTFDNVQTKDFSADLEDFEVPTNVAVLKQLINKLPSGVSKQTGAQIIKQTMEALGISMKSVLQEAQQVQDNLNISVRECQASVIEHKKQINMLERQSQKLQRQYAALNDVISLFIQTNI